jgi:hypothetical protein
MSVRCAGAGEQQSVSAPDTRLPVIVDAGFNSFT